MSRIDAYPDGVYPGSKHDRNRAIVVMRRGGATFKQIGKEFGITSARARYISLDYEMKDKWSRTKFMNHIPASRPIDMGGSDGVVHEWTPEMQAREFGMI